jgi:hypothetical protein
MASEANNFANALRRMGGMWGSAWDEAGSMLTDVVRVTATTARNRIEVPLVGQQRVGYKPGRITNEGSIAFQKIDTGWELRVYNALTLDVNELRRLRDAGQFGDLDGTFSLKLVEDDPHAFGKEVWQLRGCQIWQMELTMDTAEDFKQRELPLTYESVSPIRTFRVEGGVVTAVHSLTA